MSEGPENKGRVPSQAEALDATVEAPPTTSTDPAITRDTTPPFRAAPRPPPTQVGRYVVEGLVGRGGMGEVYAARDPELDRRVAIKLLRTELAGVSADATQRLRREARAIAKLTHPNVVTVHDVGSSPDGVFIAMELVDGESLDVWLAAARRPWREVVRVFVQAGEGLLAAHGAGVIHRDFKPANVLLGRDGRVRVTDFGVARLVDGDGGVDGARRPSLALIGRTVEGAIIGTPMYMAPEQLEGERVDERADQFSFAVSLYEALYGERPFAGETLATLAEDIHQERVRPVPAGSDVPAWLREVVLRALRAAPEARYPAMPELLAALRHDPAPARRRVRRRLLGAAMAGFAVVATASVFSLAKDRTARPAIDCTAEADRALATWYQERASLPASEQASTLDRMVSGWRAASIELCKGEHADPRKLGLQRSCLATFLDIFAIHAAQLRDATPHMRTRVGEELARLPERDHCLGQGRVRYPDPLPVDASARMAALEASAGYLRVETRGPDMPDEVAEASARSALARAEESRHAPTIAAAWSVLAGVLQLRGDIDGAIAALHKSITFAERGGAAATLAYGHLLLSSVLCTDPQRAFECDAEIERATTYFEAYPDDGNILEFQTSRAGYLAARFAPDRGVDLLRVWLAAHPDAERNPTFALALGRNLELDGRFRDADAAYSSAVDTARQAQQTSKLAELLESRCAARLELGDLAGARQVGEELSTLATRDPSVAPMQAGCAAMLSLATGDVKTVAAMLAASPEEPPFRAEATYVAFLLTLGRIDDARTGLAPVGAAASTLDWNAIGHALNHVEVAIAGRDLRAAHTLLGAIVTTLSSIPDTAYARFTIDRLAAELALAEGALDRARVAIERLGALRASRGDAGSRNHALAIGILAAEACLRARGERCDEPLRSVLAGDVAGAPGSLEQHAARMLAAEARPPVDTRELCREWALIAPYRTAPLLRSIDARRLRARCRAR